MVIVNGMPKSGTHAVMAWLSRLGLKRCPGVISPVMGSLVVHGKHLDLATLETIPDSTFIQGHIPAGVDVGAFSVITIFRDPRNVLVSYVRHRVRWGGVVLTLPEALNDFWGAPFVSAYSSYLGWRGQCVALRYEDLSPTHIGDGSDIYQADRPEWDKWIGNTRTGTPSNWQEYWTGDVEEAWKLAGGPKLLKRAGYL